MSYPYDIPAISMDNVWNSGSYTPEDVVVYIRDNYTPVNKTSMRNSVGYQLSLVQNFVNEHYLGRSNLPVHSGYIDYIYSSGIETDLISLISTNYQNIINSQEVNLSVSAASTKQDALGFYLNRSNNFVHLSITGLYTSEFAGINTTSSFLGASGLYFTHPLGDPTSIVNSDNGELQFNSTVHIDVATPLITLTNNSSRMERIYNQQENIILSTNSPTSIDTGIDHLKDVSLLYFAFHAYGAMPQQYQDNWIPANYSPFPSGFPVMTNSTTLSTFLPHAVPADAYSGEYWQMQYGAHLLQKGVPSKWYIIVSPVSSELLLAYGNTENKVQCRYTLAVFD